jgi:hypothetical protein
MFVLLLSDSAVSPGTEKERKGYVGGEGVGWEGFCVSNERGRSNEHQATAQAGVTGASAACFPARSTNLAKQRFPRHLQQQH